LYGTTVSGGANNNGTVFKITPGGTLTTLYSFCAQTNCTDGLEPDARLVQATDGNFYGTTSGGGNGWGTIFKITPGGTMTTLHRFDVMDGANPYGGLVQATNGNFYGTTSAGGANGYGAVFEITPGGALTTLHSFLDTTDGAYPYGGLMQATNGSFYGTTSGVLLGGRGADTCTGAGSYGTIFEITPSGTLTTLYAFGAQPDDGACPFGGLVQATDRNFYGTTTEVGGGYGTIFKITPAGTLHRFDNTDGANPLAGLVQATNGTLYGTTFLGGASNDGTVFSLSESLGPFVETNPTSGKVGTAVIILGNNLAGATSVTFNGKAATFKVVSSTEIKTTVPKGATTGKVSVKTPSRTLTSNVDFRVP
jgi:uncharacterized repeat protein (TIGR03803 family)